MDRLKLLYKHYMKTKQKAHNCSIFTKHKSAGFKNIWNFLLFYTLCLHMF